MGPIFQDSSASHHHALDPQQILQFPSAKADIDF